MTLSFDKNDVYLSIRPKKSTLYFKKSSTFAVATQYNFFDDENVKLIIDFQKAKVKLDANHTYYRFSDISGKYKASYSILPEETSKNKFGRDFLVNLPLSLIFEGIGILLISAIVGLITESIIKAFIAFFILIVAVSIYEVIEEMVLDKLFTFIKKKLGMMKEPEKPLFFETCAKSDYIAYCFNDINVKDDFGY